MPDSIIDAIKESIVKETPVEPIGNLPVDSLPTEPAVVPDKPIELDINDFNEKYGKKFGREIKDPKELEDIFSAPNKVKEFEAKIKEHEDAHGLTKKELADLRAEYESKKDNLQYFNIREHVGEDLLKINEMRKKYPDKDASIMSQISRIDIDKADPIDLLVKKARLDNFEIFDGKDDSYVKRFIGNRKFGNEVDLNDKETWNDTTEDAIKLEAKDVRKEFKELQNVELPVPVDVEKLKSDRILKEKQQFEQSKGQWSPIVDKMLNNVSSTEISFKDAEGELIKHTPELDDAFKAEVNQMLNFIAYQNLPIDEKTLTEVRNEVTERWIGRNATKIMRDLQKKITTELTDKFHDETHNDTPLSSQTRPEQGSGDVMEKIMDILKR
jgi:hypothetical protein